MVPVADRFATAVARFDAANTEDPNSELFEGRSYPKEWLYAQRMSAWLDKLAPDASEALRLAVRCQHIQRWVIPRRDYPMDRRGYRRWRNALARFHAATAGDILREVGYDDATIRRVQTLLRKEGLKRDAEVQGLEDVACLVFLESYFADFASRHETGKVIDIIQKTWKKMSTRGRAMAATLCLPDEAQTLLAQALKTRDEGVI